MPQPEECTIISAIKLDEEPAVIYNERGRTKVFGRNHKLVDIKFGRAFCGFTRAQPESIAEWLFVSADLGEMQDVRSDRRED